ncbi:hypothetical protein FLA105534_01462 [Flavobacterium bizetiae]|uniref:Lipocalin-like domain-containing protein n=1 Tax=Flavobacterium bizetiae TaxID=2704140 RepID=A0A6J4GCX4_9FLAO|nr:hypothetical protein [Flavobacterium bizetiae]CAA9197081.1 hypothetical protein FLA105534_01462 [Flavobacterium bizetiae]CAD5341530.1 hypothetical protein FLA105535_01504 [Flavobacterium bizetiae]CAD5347997.1 hypothetical protein FLA105534_01956 [Flavobacterium bizetiae]
MKKLFLILLLLIQIPTVFGQNQSEDPTSKKIIGTWFMDKNRNTRWVFSQDGKVYNYDKDTFKVMYRYTISNSCQNNSSDNVEFITLMDKDGNEYCFRINAINENKNGVLSLTKMDNMELLVFVNNTNVIVR